MKEFAWLFPIIFIVHDMEEIIGVGLWLRKNKGLLKEKYPWVSALYKDFSTEGFSVAVLEELVICILLSWIMKVSNSQIITYVWLGAFIGCTIHFVIHIGQSVVMKQYIPSLITSILCLPISIWIIYKCVLTISGFSLWLITCILIGIIFVAINLILAQKLIGWFTRKMNIKPLI